MRILYIKWCKAQSKFQNQYSWSSFRDTTSEGLWTFEWLHASGRPKTLQLTDTGLGLITLNWKSSGHRWRHFRRLYKEEKSAEKTWQTPTGNEKTSFLKKNVSVQVYREENRHEKNCINFILPEQRKVAALVPKCSYASNITFVQKTLQSLSAALRLISQNLIRLSL